MSDKATMVFQAMLRNSPYPVDAYIFVREALARCTEQMQATQRPRHALPLDTGPLPAPKKGERHVSGQQLCESVRELALVQFGYMARAVLRNWNIHSTRDLGEIVYNMIEIGLMKKSPQDNRADFVDVYDFEHAFERDFQFSRLSRSESR